MNQFLPWASSGEEWRIYNFRGFLRSIEPAGIYLTDSASASAGAMPSRVSASTSARSGATLMSGAIPVPSQPSPPGKMTCGWPSTT